MKHRSIYIFIILLFISAIQLNAQVTVSGSNGGVNVNKVHTTLKAAFDSLNTQTTQAGYTINITITANTTETASAVLNQPSVSTWTSLTIKPTGTRTISGTVAGAALINLNGADRVTINGLNTGGNSLTISNLSTAATAGTSTIRFIADACSNKITNCTLLGATTATTAALAGTILFSTGTTIGNDNDTISNNNIGDTVGTPSMAITSSGTSTAVDNDSIVISANNIYNWYSTTGANAINIIANSSAWTIKDNKFYQTASRTGLLTANYLKCINIVTASGNGYNISFNTLGYTSSTATGMFTNSGGCFTGIDITVAASPLSNIQGNTINNVNWTTASAVNTPGGAAFNGIIVKAGGVNVGNTTANTIGASNGIG
ncbi:MAG: hypothetical protein ACOYOV_17820, partial [Bacteroidales bacterium]